MAAINFFRKYDLSIKNKLSAATVDGVAVPVHYAYAEPEFVTARFPSFTFYRYSVSRASHRKHNYKEMKGRNWYYTDDTHTNLRLVRHPEPYDIFYQIDTYAKYQSHDIELQEYIIRVFDTHGYLTIPFDYSQEDETVAMSMVVSLVLDSVGEDGKRILRKTYRYRVEAWYEFEADAPILSISGVDLQMWNYDDQVVKWSGNAILNGSAYIV